MDYSEPLSSLEILETYLITQEARRVLKYEPDDLLLACLLTKFITLAEYDEVIKSKIPGDVWNRELKPIMATLILGHIYDILNPLKKSFYN